MLTQIRLLFQDLDRLRQMHTDLPAAANGAEGTPAVAAAQLARVADAAWDRLLAAEQAAIVSAWVERIDYDATQGQVTITFRREAIAALVHEEDFACRR